jgi:serine protease AprX
MKKILLILLLAMISGLSEAQFIASKFRVTFTDKNGSPYSISNPSVYLSAKALARRTAQGIPIVENDLPINPWYIDSIRNIGVTILNPSKWFNSVTIFTIDSNKINKILTFPFVLKIDSLAETPVKKGAKRIPKNHDSLKEGSQSFNGKNNFEIPQTDCRSSYLIVPSMNFNYGPSYTQIHMLGTDSLHNMGYRGQGMTIAILDAGFYNVDSLVVFDSLWVNNQILGTKDFVLPGNNVFNSGTHGMMVLSTMGGNLPGQIIGTAPKANYWLLHTEDANSEYPIEEDNWASGAEFADSVGADIINSSLGYTNFDNPEWSHTYTQMNGHTTRCSQAAWIASTKGIIVVNSAGNSGDDTWNYIGAPADADSIITVGAVDENEAYVSFSSNGPTYDNRVKPTVCAMGLDAIVCNSTGGVTPGSGTSFSSPIMCGSVACLWQANPNLNNYQIIEVLKQCSDKYLTPDTCYGYGIPNLIVANIILSDSQIHNFDIENQINVFPNPFQDYFSIIFYGKGSEDVTVELFDSAGKSVFKRESIKRDSGYTYIPLKGFLDLVAGFYILKVTSGIHSCTNKLLKSK